LEGISYKDNGLAHSPVMDDEQLLPVDV